MSPGLLHDRRDSAALRARLHGDRRLRRVCPSRVVDETLANRYWKGAEALGKRIRTTGDTTWFTIVGVVGAVRDWTTRRRPPEPHLYNSLPQIGGNPLSLAIRTHGRSRGASSRRCARAVAQIEPAIPLDGVRTFSSDRRSVVRHASADQDFCSAASRCSP